ncbi:TPA: signal peptidase I [Clostridioides difficile]|uniref:signal peptidase I n=1 Tax=Clostridioides difficile TaxID=1496 RepID=UPI000BB1D8A9|nr:signal peptidase I [Clostridioides difficile]EGT3644235.1 signal peptidase I [Clostridioides difficile]MBH7168531.1 signal peptidase I [Clostridioides difficile]MBH7847831.1 signal peptidase I [Clostridioides difficile]MBY1346146.1 signal peptidase I [Clostridioides difficile]MBY1662583.1 signal peptidase I [Clostridioides difficile]
MSKKQVNEKFTFKDIVVTAILSIIAFLLISSVIRLTTVMGHSMDQTLYDGEKLIISKIAYNKEDPKYKDVVVIKRSDLNVKYIIKRVIAVEGDTLKIINNKLYINDKLIEENYINEKMQTSDLEIKIPKGKIFVMGDNRNNSIDSRSSIVGLIDQKDIEGKVIFNLSQFKKFKS